MPQQQQFSPPLYDRDWLASSWRLANSANGRVANVSNDVVLASLLQLNPVKERLAFLELLPRERSEKIRKLLQDNGVYVGDELDPSVFNGSYI